MAKKKILTDKEVRDAVQMLEKAHSDESLGKQAQNLANILKTMNDPEVRAKALEIAKKLQEF